MYVCVYVLSMYVYMYVCVCMNVCICMYVCMYVCVYVCIYVCIYLCIRAENIQTFVRLRTTPTLMFAHMLLCNQNIYVWSTMLSCSRKVKAVLLAASALYLNPAMLNLSRNSDRNKTSTCYKAIIQFWRLSIANQGKSNIDKNTCKPSNIYSFLLTYSFEYCFPASAPPLVCMYVYICIMDVCT